MDIHRAAYLKKQQGSAVVFALAVTALVAAIATALLLWLRYDIRRVDQLDSMSKRYQMLQLSEMVMAKKLYLSDEPQIEEWEYELDGYTIESELEDLTGRFNINTLKYEDNPAHNQDYFYPASVYQRLLTALDADMRYPDKQVFAISELEYVDEDVKPYLYASYPIQTAVNINTTSPLVLSAILGVEQSVAESILDEGPFTDFESIMEALKKHNLTYENTDVIRQWLGVNSRVYLLKTCIEKSRRRCAFTVIDIGQEPPVIQHRTWGEMS